MKTELKSVGTFLSFQDKLRSQNIQHKWLIKLLVGESFKFFKNGNMSSSFTKAFYYSKS